MNSPTGPLPSVSARQAAQTSRLHPTGKQARRSALRERLPELNGHECGCRLTAKEPGGAWRRLASCATLCLPRALALLVVGVGLATAHADPAVVHNYHASETGTSGAVWAIAQAGDGTLFVGSNRLGIYDGRNWETIDIPGAYAFRALAAASPKAYGVIEGAMTSRVEPGGEPESNHANRVWVGAIGAIGYLEKQPTGKWSFVSLTSELQAAGVDHAGDIWQVHAVGRGAIFITTNRVLRWNGKAFETWLMPAELHLQSFPDGPDVLVYQYGRGLHRVRAEGQPELEIPDDTLPARPMTWFIPLPASEESAVRAAMLGLGADAYHLIRRVGARGKTRESRFERIESLSASLRDVVPSYAEWIDSELLAIGTYRAGAVVIDRHGRIRTRIDRASGLDDDNITALLSDGAGRLWIGHGSGFARVDGVARTALYNYRSSLGSGLPRSVLTHTGMAHVLTSRGFFRVEASPLEETTSPASATDPDESVTQFVPLLQSKEMLHAATVVAGQLWIGGFGGIWRITADGAEQEYYSATDVLQVAESTSRAGEVLFVEGYELKSLRPTERGWASRSVEARVHDTPVSLLDIVNAPGDVASGVWVSTVASGIYRFAWSSEHGAQGPLLRPVSHYQHGRGLPQHTRNPKLIRFGARLYAFTDTDVLVLSSDGRAFTPAEEMADFVGVLGTNPADPQRKGGQALWLVRPRALAGLGSYALLQVNRPDTADGRLDWHPVELAGLDHAGRLMAAAIASDPGGTTLWIAGTESILRVETQQLHPAAAAAPASFLGVSTDANRRPVIPASASQRETLWEPATKRVTFSYTTPRKAGGEPAFFQTRLSGIETDWSAPTRDMAREFTGLGHGAYTFEVRALDRFGRPGAPAAYPFRIAPPWYVTWPAFAGYAALALTGIASLTRWRMVRLRRQNEKLNRLVADRTRELELSNTVRAEFLENISHEIRNPLNGLNGLLGLLMRANLAPRERELMESLQACARNLNRTYEEVLGFSKLEYGYITKDERPFSLRAMLREIADSFAWQAAQQGCRITLESPEHSRETGDAETGRRGDAESAKVEDRRRRAENGRTAAALATDGQGDDSFIGDANKIRTIVSNFVGNALKYAPRQPVEIKVEQHAMEGDLVSVCIEVCDHGPGIPPEEQGLIFQKFVRGSNAKLEKIAGTGLGLATCRVMAKALDGSVGVESEPGRGAVFFVRIPLRRAPAAGAEKTTDLATAAIPDGSARSAALIVEDERYNQTVLRGIFVTLGYEPAVASNAAEAAALLKSSSFDLILLDWELPGLKGGDIARDVRMAPHGERPVIIATTGHDSEEKRLQCREAGMDDFLLKPYDPEAIRRCIARVRHVRASRGANGSAVPSLIETTLNLRAFDYYAAGAPEKAREAARHFVATLDRELAALERSVAARDSEQIALCAHRVRALGGLLGAADFTATARRIEILALTGTDDERRCAFRELFDAAESLKSQLAPHRPAAPAAGA